MLQQSRAPQLRCTGLARRSVGRIRRHAPGAPAPGVWTAAAAGRSHVHGYCALLHICSCHILCHLWRAQYPGRAALQLPMPGGSHRGHALYWPLRPTHWQGGHCCMCATLSLSTHAAEGHASDGHFAACAQASALVFLLAMLIIAAALLEVIFGGRSALTDLIHHRHVGFNALCTRRM